MLRALSAEHDIDSWFTQDELTELISEPDFDPASIDDQGRLDETVPKEINCTCPACGHEFIQQV